MATLDIRMRRLARGLLRVFRLSPREILTTLHAFVIIVVVESLVRIVPLPRLSRALGCHVNLDPVVPGAQRLPLKELPDRSSRRVRSARRVAHAWPFSEGPCLRGALVTGHLLREHHPAIRLGLATAGDELHAHAWVEIDGRPLEYVGAFDAFQRPPEDHRAVSPGEAATESPPSKRR